MLWNICIIFSCLGYLIYCIFNITEKNKTYFVWLKLKYTLSAKNAFFKMFWFLKNAYVFKIPYYFL